MTDSQWSKNQPEPWNGDPVGTPPPEWNPPAGQPVAPGLPPAPRPSEGSEKRLFPTSPLKFGGMFSATWEVLMAGRKQLLKVGLLACVFATVTGTVFLQSAISAGWLNQTVIDAVGGKMPAYLEDSSVELTDAQIAELVQILTTLALGIMIFSILIVGTFQFVGTALALRVTSALASQSTTPRTAINWPRMVGAWLIQNLAPLMPLLPGFVALGYGFTDPLSDIGLVAFGLGFLGVLAGIPLSIFFYASFIPMMLVAYNENLSGFKLIKRTAWLTKGSRWVSLFLTFVYALMAGMVPNIAAQVLSVISDDPFSLLGTVSLTLSSTLALILAIPFSAAAVTVIYANQLLKKDAARATEFYK